MTLTHELETLIEGRAESAKTNYLAAVVRTAGGEQLDASEVLSRLEAVGVSPAAFAEDVERQRHRNEAEIIIGGKTDWQSALSAAETGRRELAQTQSAELAKLRERHTGEMCVVRSKIDAAKQALAGVVTAEKFLDESKDVSAINPCPHRPIFGIVVRVDEARGFLSVDSDETPTRGTDLYTKYGQLQGITIKPALIGQRIEVEWFKSAHGKMLRAVRVMDDQPALAG